VPVRGCCALQQGAPRGDDAATHTQLALRCITVSAPHTCQCGVPQAAPMAHSPSLTLLPSPLLRAARAARGALLASPGGVPSAARASAVAAEVAARLGVLCDGHALRRPTCACAALDVLLGLWLGVLLDSRAAQTEAAMREATAALLQGMPARGCATALRCALRSALVTRPLTARPVSHCFVARAGSWEPSRWA
jgi:hypothetical protein